MKCANRSLCGNHSLAATATLAVMLVVLVSPGGFFLRMAHAREPAPVIDAAAASASGTVEERLQRIERRLDSQSIMEVLTRLDQLQQELQNLNGQMEVLNHEIDNIKKRQRDLYVDIDRRITQVEQKAAELAKSPPTGTPAMATGSSELAPGQMASMGSPMGSSSMAPSAPAVSGAAPAISVTPQATKLQREAYDRAFNLLKDGRYELAIASFKAYLETYPNADYADNAQYWLGEANYAQRRYDVALQEFNKVLDNYPKSGKRADAMLKMGFSYQELGKTEEAEGVLSNIVSMFPDTTAARLAKKRLQDIKRR